MDFSKAPPIVIGSDGNILDGYHRANVAKALKVPTLKAWVGVKKQGVAEASSSAQQAAIAIAKKKDIEEEKVRLDPKCWTGKHKEGTKIKGGVRVNNCVPNKK